jgi:NADH-quinone oxidoreductase subunit J
LLGLAGVAYLFVGVMGATEGEAYKSILPMIFGIIGVMAAVRVTTHRRPVFAALYFVLVVVASAGLFLLLQAEFMAFAIIIVYAGAILITYLFVLMLAQQSTTDETDAGASWYDRTPREPALAVLAGFIMLAALTQSLTEADGQSFMKRSIEKSSQSTAIAWQNLERLPKQLLRAAQDVQPETREIIGTLTADGDTATIKVRLENDQEETITLPPSSQPANNQNVGLALVADFPVSLELAGIVLLMAMFGAVVLARRQIELGEDEARELAGMQPTTERGGDE